MSISTTIKNDLIKHIQDNCPSVQQIYGHIELNPSGWPCVFVKAYNLAGEFVDTANNSRIYSFRAIIAFPLGQDMPGLPANTNREEFAEQSIAVVLDEIINAIDTNFELGGTPVLYVEAADADWGQADMDAGQALAIEITLRIYTEFRVQ